MTRLLAALAGHPRVGVDVNVAAGEAISSWSRAKNIVLVSLITACVLLVIGYAHLAHEVDTIRNSQEQSQNTRIKVLELETKILGQVRARSHSSP